MRRPGRPWAIVGLLAFAPFDRALIAAALAISAEDATRVLGELVRYSLLARPGDRYEVTHRLVHTYARERLAPPPATVARLAAYYTAAVQEWWQAGAEGLPQLDQARPHVLAVQEACQAQQVWQAAIDLEWAMDDYLDLRGHWLDWVRSLEIALSCDREIGDRRGEGDRPGQSGHWRMPTWGRWSRPSSTTSRRWSSPVRSGTAAAKAPTWAIWALAYAALGQVAQAIEYYEQALVIAREIGDRRGEGADLGNLGSAYPNLGQVEQAIEYYEQALVIAREIGDRRGEGADLGNLGTAYAALGQVGQAIEYYEQALVIAREIGDRRGEGADLGNLGNAYAALGQVRQAIEYYEQALVIAREIGDRRGEGNHLGNLGTAYAALGQVDKAIEYYEQALVIAREIGDRRGEGNRPGQSGPGVCRPGAGPAGHRVLRAGAGHRPGDRGPPRRRHRPGQSGQCVCRPGAGRRRPSSTTSRPWSSPVRSGTAAAKATDLGNLGLAYAALGQVDQAIEYYEQALVIAREIGDRRGEGNHLGNLGTAYADLGQVDAGHRVLRAGAGHRP